MVAQLITSHLATGLAVSPPANAGPVDGVEPQ